MKPVFFQVAQAQKAPPPVTQAVSLTLMVVFTLGAQGLQSQPYVSVTCSAASCATLPTACLTIDATTGATTADDAATSVHTTFHLAKRHVRTGGPPKKSKVTIALAWATLALQTVSAPNKMGGGQHIIWLANGRCSNHYVFSAVTPANTAWCRDLAAALEDAAIGGQGRCHGKVVDVRARRSCRSRSRSRD